MNGQSPFRDTIFALSSGGLPSGVAVIRLSGPRAGNAVARLAGALPPPRRAVLRELRDVDGVVLDRALVLFFPSPASVTGEDCAEFHVHGGRAVVAAVLRALGALPGLRQAEAGEFTRRAFVNGRMDLTGAEALADLIGAETEAQRRLALDNVEGGQQALYSGWRSRLLHARAMIEAELDFADEADVPGAVSDRIWTDMRELCEEIDGHVEGFRAAEVVRDGFCVVLVGAPNAGKSSLLNALARREVAIVTDVAGTTRDLVEVTLDLDGMKVLVVDTAGLRETQDKVERIGVEKAIAAASRADLVLELVDPRAPEQDQVDRAWQAPVLRVATKSDLWGTTNDGFDHVISVVTADGLGRLIAEIARRAETAGTRQGAAVPTRLRHVELLRATKAHVLEALVPKDLELRAEQLRLASASLGRITGTVDVEELLDVIYSQFCIGK